MLPDVFIEQCSVTNLPFPGECTVHDDLGDPLFTSVTPKLRYGMVSMVRLVYPCQNSVPAPRVGFACSL